MAGRLDGLAALITGGGSGIGAAIARAFAAEGARVAVAGRRRPLLATVAAEIGGIAIQADVASEPDIAAMVAEAVAVFGRLDVLVNNAGLGGPTARVEETDTDAWDACFAVNARGPALCMKHAMPHLKRTRGAVINISSRMGLKPKVMRGAYTASKHALNAITEAIAQEVGPAGVRANTICPGAVRTELFDALTRERAAQNGISVEEQIRRDYLETAALRKLVEVRDIAEAAVFLAGAEGAAITGFHLKIDGGRGQ